MTAWSRRPPRLGQVMLAALLAAACGPRSPAGPTVPPPLSAADVRDVAPPEVRGFDAAAAEQMRAAYDKAVDLAGRPDTTPQSLAQAYGDLGVVLLAYDRVGAGQALSNAAALSPKDPRWSYFLGRFYQRQGDTTAAERWFARTLSLQPRDQPTHVRLAQVLRAVPGRSDEAARVLEAAIALGTDCALCHFLLGQIRLQQGDHAAAIAHFETTLRLQPHATTVHGPLSAAYRAQGDRERAEEHAALLGLLWPTVYDPLDAELGAIRQGFAGALLQAEQARMQGDATTAIARYQQAVEARPDDISARVALGLARADAGDPTGGVVELRRAQELDPGNSEVTTALGDLLVEVGRLEEAESVLAAGIDADPTNADLRFTLAEVLRQTGRCEGALVHYATALALQPGRTDAYAHQAGCLVELGRAAEARAVLEAALAGFPDDAALADALARVPTAEPDGGEP